MQSPLLKTLDADLDGDGKKEVVAVTSGDKGVQLALVGENAEGAVVTQVAPPALGKELAKAEVKALVPPKGSQQIILEVYDDDRSIEPLKPLSEEDFK